MGKETPYGSGETEIRSGWVNLWTWEGGAERPSGPNTLEQNFFNNF